MSRWIRMQVDLHEHSVFAPEPFTEREAWQWMIGRAAWKETAHRVGASVHKVPVGSFFATIREMQAAWKWTSTRRVAQFLDLLASQNMIETNSETGKTLVSICNYVRYQIGETPSETPEKPNPKQERNTKDTSTPDTSSLRSDNLSAKPDFDMEFETEFWPVYPRKVGKGQALKAYRAARKQSDCETIAAGARRYAAERAGEDQQFTRHAATWLNGQGWLDEPASKPSPRSQAPPGFSQKPPSPAMQRHERIKQDIKREIYGDDDADTSGPTIDLAARDYFTH